MSEPTPLVTIFGGSGFIGRYIAQRMARRGWRVRVAVRRPNDAMFVRTYGVVGQVEPVQANIRYEDSVARAVMGADAVVNCIGILDESGAQRFDAVINQGAARIARLAREAGVDRLVQISAIGADPASESGYGRAKGLGEKAVLDAFPGATILRPSIVFGPEDEFFNRFAGMARLSPVLPVVGADTRFQPVYVGDVADAAAMLAAGEAEPGLYELAGPQVETFRQLLERMLKITRRKRLILDLPPSLARLPAGALSLLQGLTGGLYVNRTLTKDQIAQLGRDNVAAEGAKGLKELGIQPTTMDAVLESYLYSYRPAGQYSKLAEGAERLRKS